MFYVRYADPAQSISSFLGHHFPGDRCVTRRKDHGLDGGAELWSANFARPRAATAVERSLSRSVGASALPCRAMAWTTPLSASSRASRHDDGVWAGGHALSARRLEKAARLPERISAARVFRGHQGPDGVGCLIGLPRGLWQEAHHVGAAGQSRSGLRHRPVRVHLLHLSIDAAGRGHGALGLQLH